MCCTRLAGNTGRKNYAKIAICAPSHNFVRLYLRNWGTYRQSEKNLLNSNSMSSQYGKLRPTNGWDPFESLGHPSEFKRVLRLGSVTTRDSSSGRQPNSAALNRGRHLYSAGRPSRWPLAHILVEIWFHLLYNLDSMRWFFHRPRSAPEDGCRKNAALFRFFVPGNLDLWPWRSNSGEIFVQCT